VTQAVESNPHDQKVIQTAKDQIFDLLLYRTNSIKLFPCIKEVVFGQGDMKKARKVEHLLRTIVLICFSIEVFCTAFDLMLTSLNDGGSVDTKQF